MATTVKTQAKAKVPAEAMLVENSAANERAPPPMELIETFMKEHGITTQEEVLDLLKSAVAKSVKPVKSRQIPKQPKQRHINPLEQCHARVWGPKGGKHDGSDRCQKRICDGSSEFCTTHLKKAEVTKKPLQFDPITGKRIGLFVGFHEIDQETGATITSEPPYRVGNEIRFEWKNNDISSLIQKKIKAGEWSRFKKKRKTKTTVKKPTVKKTTGKKPTGKKTTVKKPTGKESTGKKPTEGAAANVTKKIGMKKISARKKRKVEDTTTSGEKAKASSGGKAKGSSGEKASSGGKGSGRKVTEVDAKVKRTKIEAKEKEKIEMKRKAEAKAEAEAKAKAKAEAEAEAKAKANAEKEKAEEEEEDDEEEGEEATLEGMEYEGKTYYVYSGTGDIYKLREDGEDIEKDSSGLPVIIGKWNFEEGKPELD